MKHLAEMTHDELVNYAMFVAAGLTAADIAKEFKTDDALRAFLADTQKLRGTIIEETVESKVGWDAGEDATEPDDEIKRATAKKKAALKASIKKTGSKVSVADVQSALDALGDDEDSPEDN